jgi:phosphopantetheinyl transferase
VVFVQHNTDVLVIYAPIGEVDMSEPLIPYLRDLEVRECKSESVKREKYLVWKLLRRAVEEYFKLDFANLTFTKTANGKWICPDFYFSLSHTDGAVCVALAKIPVGVDIEKIRHVGEKLPERFLSCDELEYMNTLQKEEREAFFLEAWVKKESIFKRLGEELLMPRQRSTLGCDSALERVFIGGYEYLIGVSPCSNIKYEILFLEEI